MKTLKVSKSQESWYDYITRSDSTAGFEIAVSVWERNLTMRELVRSRLAHQEAIEDRKNFPSPRAWLVNVF